MVFTVHPHVTWIDETDEIRLYQATTNQFQSLNATGAQIWRLIIDGCDEPQIIAQMMAPYHPVTDELHHEITQDIQAYLTALCESELIQRADAPPLAPLATEPGATHADDLNDIQTNARGRHP